jgi:hypothetical protein
VHLRAEAAQVELPVHDTDDAAEQVDADDIVGPVVAVADDADLRADAHALVWDVVRTLQADV